MAKDAELKTEAVFLDDYSSPRLMTHERHMPNYEARIATGLIERWGMVAAEVDGEDSAGRSKMRRMTPEELVSSACDTAQKLVAEFHARGWMTELPSMVEQLAALKAEKEERRSSRAA